MPTLIVSPPPLELVLAAGEAAADGLAEPAGLSVALGELLAQAFSSKLVPNVAEPYIKNLRRLIRFAIFVICPLVTEPD